MDQKKLNAYTFAAEFEARSQMNFYEKYLRGKESSKLDRSCSAFIKHMRDMERLAELVEQAEGRLEDFKSKHEVQEEMLDSSSSFSLEGKEAEPKPLHDMIPLQESERPMLCGGQDARARLQYLKKRAIKAPDERYAWPMLSSWEISWGFNKPEAQLIIHMNEDTRKSLGPEPFKTADFWTKSHSTILNEDAAVDNINKTWYNIDIKTSP